MKKLLAFTILLTLCVTIGHAQGPNVKVVNPDSQPVPVKVVSGGGGGAGDASAANQTAVQANAGSDATKAVSVQGITGGKPVPVSGTVTATVTAPTATTVPSTALEASHVLKSAAGSLVSLTVYDSVAEYILVMNSTTVPADGAVTLLCPPIKVAADTTTMITFPIPLTASTGISVSNSSTGSFTKTIGGSTCAFTGQVQ
jgi:hypothetical protein